MQEVDAPYKWDSDGNRPPMMIAKILNSIYQDASKVSQKTAEVDLKRLNKSAEFLDLAEKNGFDNQSILNHMNDALNLAKENTDTRALARLTELMHKMFLQPANDFNRFFIQLQQNNIKLGTNAPKSEEDVYALIESLPEKTKKEILIRWLEQYG